MKFKIEVEIEISNGIAEDLAKTTLEGFTKHFKDLTNDCWLQPLSVEASLTLIEKRIHTRSELRRIAAQKGEDIPTFKN
jgi:hypothetical protein